MKNLSQDDVNQIIREVSSDEKFVDACRKADAAGLFDYVMPAPGSPGLYAVVAGDGVTVRVVDGRVTQKDLYAITHHDIASRVLVERWLQALPPSWDTCALEIEWSSHRSSKTARTGRAACAATGTASARRSPRRS